MTSTRPCVICAPGASLSVGSPRTTVTASWRWSRCQAAWNCRSTSPAIRWPSSHDRPADGRLGRGGLLDCPRRVLAADDPAVAELGPRWVAVFGGLWLIGYAGSGWLDQGTAIFVSYVAMLDVALVLFVFKA